MIVTLELALGHCGTRAAKPAVTSITRVEQLVMVDAIFGHLSHRRHALTTVEGEVVNGDALLVAIERLRTSLRRVGVHPGDRVLVPARRTVAGVAGLLAVMAEGAIAVPHAPDAPAKYLERVKRDARAIATLDGSKLTVHQHRASVEVPSDATLLVYTSGTTGDPKGIVHTHHSLHASATMVAEAWGITDEDRLLHVLPLHHVHGLVVALLGILAVGGSVSFAPSVDPSTVATQARECSLLFGVPTMYSRLARAGQVGELASLRLAICGSAPLDRSLAASLADDGVPILERYGMTETCLTLTQPVDGVRIPGTVGGPFPGVETRIVDGELHVKTPALAAGIFGSSGGLPSTPDGWFATGDLAVLEDGAFRIVGRRSNLIISGGYNVQPEAVEAVALECAGVVGVLVRGEPDADLGEAVVALVVGDADLTTSKVAAYLADRLPRYVCPRRIELVDELPRNEMGKLLRG